MMGQHWSAAPLPLSAKIRRDGMSLATPITDEAIYPDRFSPGIRE
jgi:hypothetical protein